MIGVWDPCATLYVRTIFCAVICFHLLSYRTDKDKETKSPYLLIHWYGGVEYTNEQVVTTACRMRVYKFPFDVQRCNISFKSIMHSGESISSSTYMCFSYSHIYKPWNITTHSPLFICSHLFFYSILDNEIELIYNKNNKSMTTLTRSMMWTQYEWTFENLTATNKSSIMYPHQTVIIYTVSTS